MSYKKTYGERLVIEYDDIRNRTTRIEVWSKGYVGAAMERDGQANPLTIEWGDSGSADGFPVVYGSTATVRLWAEDYMEMAWLFDDEDPFKNMVLIFKEDRLIWSGFVNGEQYEEVRQYEPPIEFVASDMLAYVCSLPATEVVSDNPIRLEPYLEAILDLTRSYLPLVHGIDWDVQGSSYQSLYIDRRAFSSKNLTIGDVLNSLFYGMRLFQRDGAWNLISYSNYTREKMLLTVPDVYLDDFRAGDYTSGDFVTRVNGTSTKWLYPNSRPFWFEGIHKTEILLSHARQAYKEDLGRIENLLINGDFSDGINGWEESEPFVTASVIDGGLGNADKNIVKLVRNPVYSQRGALTQQFRAVQSSIDTNTLRFRIKYGIVGNTVINDVLRVILYIEETALPNRIFYGYNAISSVTGKLAIKWSESPSHINLGSVIESGSVVDKPVFGSQALRIGEKMQSWEIISEDIPVSGIPKIMLMTTDPNVTNVGDAVFANVSIDIVDSNHMQYPGSREYITEGSGGRFTPRELTFHVADIFPYNLKNKWNLYYCPLYYFTLGQINYPIGYRVFGPDFYDLNTFRTRLMLALAARPRQNYIATLADLVPGMKCVITDPENENLKYLENGIAYDDRRNVISGQFTEIINPENI